MHNTLRDPRARSGRGATRWLALLVGFAIGCGDGGRTGVAVATDSAPAVNGAARDSVAAEPTSRWPFRIRPHRPIEELRAEARAARPPLEEGDFLPPDLVDLTGLEAGFRFDIRYAGENNFLATRMYETPGAFLQRPAAEALVRAHRSLAAFGFGLLIHDAYRPWYVTRMFWDATPANLRDFVADPATGSRHNRGAAVDVSLFRLDTGEPVTMPSDYDEFSERAAPDYAGGSRAAREARDLLRRAMEAEGFIVFENEWWHFDYTDWRRYPLMNASFSELRAGDEERSRRG